MNLFVALTAACYEWNLTLPEMQKMLSCLQRLFNLDAKVISISATASGPLHECCPPLKRWLPPMNNAVKSYLFFGGKKLSRSLIGAPDNETMLILGNGKSFVLTL